MLTLPLEPTDDRANPPFKDNASCAQWLGQLQLTNLQQAQAALRSQLDEFNRYPMRGLERLQVLELLRETVNHVQSDYARKLAAKALPLGTHESTIFESLTGLWQGMLAGYQRCLQTYLAGDQQLQPYGALLCHRCLSYGSQQILEYLRISYEIDGPLWQQLHALYAFVEEQGLQSSEVEDKLGMTHGASSCRAVYVKILLLGYAHPEELSRGQLQMLDRWLSQWAATLPLERNYAASKGDALPLAVDLDGTSGLQPLKQAILQGGNLRYLAMVPLSKLLRVKIILLQQGQTPQQLELDGHLDSGDCAEFLGYLHRCWCEERPERLAERHRSGEDTQVCYGLEGIYAHLANKPFRQPSRGSAYGSEERSNQIATFGRALSDTNRHSLASLGYVAEIWKIEDESLLGARLLRQAADGIRLNAKQIVATRNAEACVLGAITWLTVTSTGQLHAGIRYLPGKPEPISVKAGSSSAAALLLPALSDLKIPASLVIPRNLFQAGQTLEITVGGEKKTVKMGISVEKGADYERISFSEAKVI